MTENRESITRLLGDMARGQDEAHGKLVALVYKELHDIARHLMRGERADHTLQATALVNEAFLRLLGGPPIPWESRTHFFAVAGTAMRRILVDYARSRGAEKRGGAWQRVDLEEPAIVGRDDLDQAIAIDQALTRLEALDPRHARVVELRFFVGLSEEEIADHLQLSTRTVKRDWRLARAWLQAELADPAAAATQNDRAGSV